MIFEGELVKTVLFLNGCLRANHSRTLKIAYTYVKKIREREEFQLIERVLPTEHTQYLSRNSFDPQTGELKDSDVSLAKELAAADDIIVAAPFWEFLFPAAISCYFEMVSVPSITFKYTKNGSEGLCRAKSMTYIYTSGDYLSDEDKIGELYLKRIAKLYGIPNFSAILVQGLDAEPEKADVLIADVCQKIESGSFPLFTDTTRA